VRQVVDNRCEQNSRAEHGTGGGMFNMSAFSYRKRKYAAAVGM